MRETKAEGALYEDDVVRKGREAVGNRPEGRNTNIQIWTHTHTRLPWKYYTVVACQLVTMTDHDHEETPGSH